MYIEDNRMRTITMTDHPPVEIDEDAWPTIASSSWYDQYPASQANRRRWLFARENATDGRRLVYGRFSTDFRSESGMAAGFLLTRPADGWNSEEGIASTTRAMRKVTEIIGANEPELVDWIGDLPAVTL